MRHVLLLLISLCVLIMTASVSAQTATPLPTSRKPPKVFYDEVLENFRAANGKRLSNDEINAQLIKEIKSSGVYIVLNNRKRKELRKAGASDELIRTIDTALTDAEKKKVAKALKKENGMNRLYRIVLDNYKSSDAKKLSLAIKAAKEFIKRFGNEEIASRNTEWLKNSLPKWETRLQKVNHVSTTNH